MFNKNVKSAIFCLQDIFVNFANSLMMNIRKKRFFIVKNVIYAGKNKFLC
jgi:hypothetical protein